MTDTIEKRYFSSKEVSEKLGITKGMCYYLRGKVRVNGKKHGGNKFMSWEVEAIKKLLES